MTNMEAAMKAAKAVKAEKAAHAAKVREAAKDRRLAEKAARLKAEGRDIHSWFVAGIESRLDKALPVRDGRVVVKTERQVMEMLPHAMKREGKSYSVTGLFMDGNCKVTPITETVTANTETPVLEEKGLVSPAVVRVGKMHRKVERYTYAFINLHVSDEKGVKLLDRSGCRIYRLIERENGKVVREEFFANAVAKGKILNLVTGETKDGGFLFAEDGSLKQGGDRWHCYLYSPAAGTSSPGQEKMGAITLACQNLEGWDAWEHHNFMMHGAPEQLLRYYGDREVSMKELAQLATRMAQSKPVVKEFQAFKSLCILIDKVKDASGNEYEDGLMRIAAEYVAEALTDNDYVVMPWAVDGMTIQCRPNCVSKGLAHVMPRQFIVEWLEEHKVAVRILAQDEIDESTQDAFNEAVIGKKGRYALTDEEKAKGFRHAAILVVPSRNGMTDEELIQSVELLEDLNVCKTTFNVSWPLSGMNVLSWCHCEDDLEDEANTSSQLLQSAMVADPVATLEWYTRKAGCELADILDDCLNGGAKSVAPSELEGDLSLVAQKINPEFVRSVWLPYYQDILNKRIKGWTGRTERIKSPIDGIYVKIIPDVAHEAGVDLLKYDSKTGVCEIFAPALEEDGSEYAVGVKYPKMGYDEFGKFRNVSRQDLLDRTVKLLTDSKITRQQCLRIQHMIQAFKTGSVMVPAIESLKNMLAGMDFDGDALILYTDEELVEIMWKIKPVAVVIMDDDELLEALAAENKEVPVA